MDTAATTTKIMEALTAWDDNRTNGSSHVRSAIDKVLTEGGNQPVAATILASMAATSLNAATAGNANAYMQHQKEALAFIKDNSTKDEEAMSNHLYFTTWGAGVQKITPELIAERKKLADENAKKKSKSRRLNLGNVETPPRLLAHNSQLIEM